MRKISFFVLALLLFLSVFVFAQLYDISDDIVVRAPDGTIIKPSGGVSSGDTARDGRAGDSSYIGIACRSPYEAYKCEWATECTAKGWTVISGKKCNGRTSYCCPGSNRVKCCVPPTVVSAPVRFSANDPALMKINVDVTNYENEPWKFKVTVWPKDPGGIPKSKIGKLYLWIPHKGLTNCFKTTNNHANKIWVGGNVDRYLDDFFGSKVDTTFKVNKWCNILTTKAEDDITGCPVPSCAVHDPTQGKSYIEPVMVKETGDGTYVFCVGIDRPVSEDGDCRVMPATGEYWGMAEVTIKDGFVVGAKRPGIGMYFSQIWQQKDSEFVRLKTFEKADIISYALQEQRPFKLKLSNVDSHKYLFLIVGNLDPSKENQCEALKKYVQLEKVQKSIAPMEKVDTLKTSIKNWFVKNYEKYLKPLWEKYVKASYETVTAFFGDLYTETLTALGREKVVKAKDIEEFEVETKVEEGKEVQELKYKVDGKSYNVLSNKFIEFSPGMFSEDELFMRIDYIDGKPIEEITPATYKFTACQFYKHAEPDKAIANIKIGLEKAECYNIRNCLAYADKKFYEDIFRGQ